MFGYDPTPELIAFDPQQRARRAKCYDALAGLQLELVRQTAPGRATPCSRQSFVEARWLVLYSVHREQIEHRLQYLRVRRSVAKSGMISSKYNKHCVSLLQESPSTLSCLTDSQKANDEHLPTLMLEKRF